MSLPNLPATWTWTTLESLAVQPKSDIVDGPFGSNLKASEYVDNGVPIIRLQNIAPNQFIHKNIRFVSPQKAKELRRHSFRAGDIVITKLGDPLGEACLVPEELSEGIVVADIVRARLSDEVSSSAVVYALNSAHVQSQLKATTKGTTRPRVNLTHVRELCLPIPPRQEQDRIVAEIEKQFTRLDDALGALKRAQSNLKRYRASVLKAACEGRLVPTEAELARKEGRDYEPASELLKRVLAERRAKWEATQLQKMIAAGEPPQNEQWRKKYKEPDAPNPADLARLPQGWCWASLDQFSWSSDYGTSEKCDYTEKGLPVIRIPNIECGRLKFADVKFTTKTTSITTGSAVTCGDLLVIRTNGSRDLIGRSAVVLEATERPYLHASYLIRFRLVNCFKWFGLIWDAPGNRSRIVANAATSAGQYNISMGELASLPIPIPPFVEMQRICHELERRLSGVEALLPDAEQTLQRSENLRRSVLRQAFEGNLVPQHSNDEPASALLERIRTHRQSRGRDWNGRQAPTNKGSGRAIVQDSLRTPSKKSAGRLDRETPKFGQGLVQR